MGRRADLKTGYNCNSNCVFCVIGDKLFTGDRSTRECLDELEASRARCEDVVFTGAEVTIREDFFVLVQAAKRLGYQSIQIQTNGRMFAYREFCERAVAAGANEFSPSIHGHIAQLHDGLTRAKGSFDQIVAATRNLKALGQRVVTNTVITKQNAKHLPALAEMLVGLRVDQFQLAFPHPTGHAATFFNGVVPRMSEIAAFVHRALQIGIDAGVACMAEAMPYCMMPGYEPQVAELHIPPTQIVYDGYVVPDYADDRLHRGKLRFEQCATCRYEPICEGPWREYPERVGSDEFQPVEGPRVIDAAVVLDDRFARLGATAPDWPQRRPGWTAICFYPEDGSPSCTAQVCSLQSGLPELAERGVNVVGVSPDDAASHRAFSAAHGLEFPLVPDEGGALARAFGVLDRGRFRRSTYLVDPQGRIAHVIANVDTGRHTQQVLEALVRLQAPAPRPRAPSLPVVAS